MSTLKEKYEKEIKPELIKEYNYTSSMEAPKLDKIVINMGVGEGAKDDKFIESFLKMIINLFSNPELDIIVKDVK